VSKKEWLPQIRAANFIHLGSKIVTLGSKNYFIWAANFISKDSRFYRDWQQFLLKWAANFFNEI
jgi:hypothetical protein